MKEPNTIDDLFKDAFDGLTVVPDASVKSAIDANLFMKSNKRKVGFWFFFVGATIGVLSVIAGIYYSTSYNSGNNVHLAKATNRLMGNGVHSRLVEDVPNEVGMKMGKSDKSTERLEKNTISVSNSKGNSKSVRLAKGKVNKSIVKNGSRDRNAKSSLNNQVIDDPLSHNKKEQITIGLLKHKQLSPFEVKRENELVIAPVMVDSAINVSNQKVNNNRAHSLTAFVNYGFESTNSDREQENYKLLENGHIQLRSAEFKLEYKRSVSNSFSLNAGLGYAYHAIIQKGRMTVWDSVPNTSSITTLNPDMNYFPTYQSGNTNYRYQQFQLGVGISYTRSLFQNWNLDLSVGSNFSIGQLKKISGSSIYESPQFSPLGFTLYFRPAIEYRLGKYSLLAYGQVSQTMVSQIKWSFIDRRNPSFGAGIGCRYYF